MTDAELRARGDQLADLQEKVERAEEEKAAKSKEYSGHIAKFNGEASCIAKEVREKCAWRYVEVETKFDFDAGTADTSRVDTGEVVTSRPLTQEERQQNLFTKGRKAKSAQD